VGSTVAATTRTRALLLEVVESLSIRSMLDVPCGGMTWQPLFLDQLAATQPRFKYLGLDIARPVIERNRQQFRGKPWKFDVLDMTRQPLPRGFDLVHTRDVLQHLPCKAVVASLENIASSGASYLMATSYDMPQNLRIQRPGGFVQYNLRRQALPAACCRTRAAPAWQGVVGVLASCCWELAAAIYCTADAVISMDGWGGVEWRVEGGMGCSAGYGGPDGYGWLDGSHASC